MLGKELPRERCEEIGRSIQKVKPTKRKALSPTSKLIKKDFGCPKISLDEGITSTAMDQIERLAINLAVMERISN